MKVINLDSRTLIYRNLKYDKKEQMPDTFTLCQYRILRGIIKQKHIRKDFFNLLLSDLYGLDDWKKLNYSQMYKTIFFK